MTTRFSTPTEQTPLPTGWRWARLGDVCEINPSRSGKTGFPDNLLVTFAPMSAVDDETGTLANPIEKKFGEVKKGYTWFLNGDVLWAKITPCMQNGKAFIAHDLLNRVGFGSTEFHVLRPTDQIISEWIWYLVRQESFRQLATQTFTGAVGQQRVPEGFLREQPIPLPPLPEQRRIAARLNEVMAEIARARAAAQAALDAANALPAALLRAVFESDEAKKWKTVRIGDVCHRRQDIVHPRDGTKGALRFVGLENIESNTGRRLGEQVLDAEALDGRKPRFSVGDVLYGYLRPYLNKVWVAEFDGVSSVDQYAFRVDKDRAIPQYISQYMRSPVYLNLAPVGFTPGFLPRIRSEEVESVPIPLPPLTEQQRISTKIDNSLEVAQQVRVSAQSQLDAINALPAAYLRRAFRGEL